MTSLNKFLLALAAIVVAVAALVLFMQKPSVPSGFSKLKVVTTLFPIYDFARQVGGEDIDVSLLLPPGVEPHSFEPTPSDIVRIHAADVFVYTGPAMEPWAGKVLSGVNNDSLVVVDASKDVRLLPATHEHGDGGEAGHELGAESADPHVWLDFDNDRVIVESIAAVLEAADPERAEAYRRRAEAYVARLKAADASFRDGLANCERRSVVYGGHYAFGYLSARYGLEYRAAQGLAPDSEPSARDLVTLVEQVRSEKLPYVFTEELVSPKIAETLASETGAGILSLNAGGNVSRDQLFGGVTFLDIMSQNLASLREGLGCEE